MKKIDEIRNFQLFRNKIETALEKVKIPGLISGVSKC